MSTSLETSKRSWRDLARREVLREYADPLATLVAALVFAFLAGFGVVKQELLAAVTLGVLAAVAAVMLRQRYVIEQAKKSFDLVPGHLAEVAAAVAKIERTVEALTSSDVYEILDHEAEWDIVASDGSLAYGRKHKKLRFNQQDVVSIYELTETSGGRPGRVEDWTFDPDIIQKVGTLSVGGEDHILLSLGTRYQRNDELDYTSTRTIRDLFTDDQNRVSHRVRERTSRLRLRVAWPQDATPRHVRIEEVMPGGDAKVEEFKGSDLQIDEGRPFVQRSYERPPRDHKVVITWWR
ncbi:MAG: hypothetical protein ACHQC8_04860 [Solirubrobacterales bacterium]